MVMDGRHAGQAFSEVIGAEGREKIEGASAAVIGCGARGSITAGLLARSGIGRLRLIDRDVVSPGPLEGDGVVARPVDPTAISRASSVARNVRRITSATRVEVRDEDLHFQNIAELCEGFDVLVDGVDNFQTRFLLNDFSSAEGIPWVYGEFRGTSGFSRVIIPGRTPCLRCLFPDPPGPGGIVNSEPFAIIRPMVQAVASFQAEQALRIIADGKMPGKELQVDALSGESREEDTTGHPGADCPCCRKSEFPWMDGGTAESITSLCGTGSVQIQPAVRGSRLDLQELAGRFAEKNVLRCNDYLLQLRINDYELTVFSNGRAIIKGVEDHVKARILYSRYIGN